MTLNQLMKKLQEPEGGYVKEAEEVETDGIISYKLPIERMFLHVAEHCKNFGLAGTLDLVNFLYKDNELILRLVLAPSF